MLYIKMYMITWTTKYFGFSGVNRTQSTEGTGAHPNTKISRNYSHFQWYVTAKRCDL